MLLVWKSNITSSRENKRMEMGGGWVAHYDEKCDG